MNPFLVCLVSVTPWQSSHWRTVSVVWSSASAVDSAGSMETGPWSTGRSHSGSASCWVPAGLPWWWGRCRNRGVWRVGSSVWMSCYLGHGSVHHCHMPHLVVDSCPHMDSNPLRLAGLILSSYLRGSKPHSLRPHSHQDLTWPLELCYPFPPLGQGSAQSHCMTCWRSLMWSHCWTCILTWNQDQDPFHYQQLESTSADKSETVRTKTTSSTRPQFSDARQMLDKKKDLFRKES